MIAVRNDKGIGILGGLTRSPGYWPGFVAAMGDLPWSVAYMIWFVALMYNCI